MQHKFAISLSFFFLLSSSPLPASEPHGGVTTLEYFTRSITNIYTVLESCKDESVTGSGESADKIREFLSGYYPDGVPYWVLPANIEHISDQNTCDFLIHDRMIAYQEASAEFIKFYPKQPSPPRFIVSKSRFFNYRIDNSSLGLVGRSRELVF